MEALEGIIEQAKARGWIDPEDVETLCRSESVHLKDVWNRIATTVAHRFLAGLMSFDDADAIINAVQAQIVLQNTGCAFPEPAFSIYQAFDAGDCGYGEKYTRGALAEILRQA